MNKINKTIKILIIIMTNILSFNGWSESVRVDENIQAAKAYLLNLEADRQGTQSSELSAELQNKALSNPDYIAILELLKNNPGYVYSFVKFKFEHGATLAQLRDLYQKIRDNAGSLNSLPMSIEEYSNEDTVNGVDSLEALMDQFHNIETRRKHKWIIEKVNGDLRRSIKALPAEDIDRLYAVAKIIDDADLEAGDFTDPETGATTNNRISLLKKSNAFKDARKYLTWAEEMAEGVSNSDVAAKIDQIREIQPEAGILYNKGGYLAISVRTEKAQKALCSIANWCINRGSWGGYGGKAKAVQINVFNFNLPVTNPLHIVGTTIIDNKVDTAHDKNDDYIKKSDDPSEHFTKLGYPEDLVKTVVGSIGKEQSIKKIVTDLDVDSSNPSKTLMTLIKATYRLAVESDDAIKNVVVKIADENIANKLSVNKIVENYKKMGILSTTSARLLNTLLPDLSSEIKSHLIKNNDRMVDELEAIVNRAGLDFNPTLTSAVQDRDKIKEIIMSGETIDRE